MRKSSERRDSHARLLNVTALACAVCCPALAEVYKWVDEKGVVQYGERPPTGSAAKQVRIDASATETGGTADARKSTEAQEAEFRKRQAAKEQAEAKEAKDKAARDAWCARIKGYAETRRNARSPSLMNSKGERVYMTAAENDALVAKYQASYDRYCR